MHIAFDAKRIFQNNTGLGNYSREAVSGLQQYFPEHEYLLFAPKRVQNSVTQPFLDPPFHTFFCQSMLPAYWRTKSIVADLQRNKVAVYHGLSHELPLGIERTSIKTVVTVHDLIFERYPEQYSFFDAKIHSWKCRSACERADAIVAVSESTKNDIIEFYGINPNKISVVGVACHERFYAQKDYAPVVDYRYILSVGSVIARKNVLSLVQAMHLLYQENDFFKSFKIVIIGRGNNPYRKLLQQYIIDNQLDTQIIFNENVTDEALPAWYANAEVLVYPSVYEGFGIPVLEALAVGTPVITSTQLALTEVSGAGATHVAPNDVPALAAALRARLYAQIPDRKAQKTYGRAQAQLFTQPVLIPKLMAVYEGVFGE